MHYIHKAISYYKVMVHLNREDIQQHYIVLLWLIALCKRTLSLRIFRCSASQAVFVNTLWNATFLKLRVTEWD